MRLVAGPNARTPQAQRKPAAAPGRTLQGRAVTKAPTMGGLLPPAQRAGPARRSVRYGVGDEPRRRHPPRAKNNDRKPKLHAHRTVGPEEGECKTLATPHGGTRRPPPAGRALLLPRQRTESAHMRVRYGVDDRHPQPQPPREKKTGSRPKLQAPRTQSCLRESAQTRTALTEAQDAPHEQPPATPKVYNASAQERALWGWLRVPKPAVPATKEKGQLAPAACL